MGQLVAPLVINTFALFLFPSGSWGIVVPCFSFFQFLDFCIPYLQLCHQIGDGCHLILNCLQLCFYDVLVFYRCICRVDKGIICLFQLVLYDCVGAVKFTLICCGFLTIFF